MEIEDQEIILREEQNFYRASYESSNINITTPESNTFFENKFIKALSDENMNTCEGKITKEECKKALNEMEQVNLQAQTALLLNFISVSLMKLVMMSCKVSTMPLTKENCQFVRKEALSLFYQRKTNPSMF